MVALLTNFGVDPPAAVARFCHPGDMQDVPAKPRAEGTSIGAIAAHQVPAYISFAEAAHMSQQQTQLDQQYAEYDPVEGQPVIVSNTEIAASGAKINTHVPTPDEIAKRKYVIRRYWSGPRWMRWLLGTDEYSPK
jgi:hypothetical protein